MVPKKRVIDIIYLNINKKPEEKLPTKRALADQFGISGNSVMNAYKQFQLIVLEMFRD